MKWLTRAGWGCASAVALFVWGCKENNITVPLEKTESAATGGAATGGAGNGGATGGAGGESTGPAPACVTPADCPEADACEKAPTCEDGVCVRGGSECGDFDADNCACVESADGSGCVVQGADKDDDGATSALCEVEPGDDCNDSLGTVYPGADEVCDGLDNDCDGLLEIDEGLSPFDRRVETPAPIAALTWSPVAEGYGVAWETTINEPAGVTYDVSFGIVKTAGTFTQTLPTVLRGDTVRGRTSVAFGDGEFGVARLYWQSQGNAVLRFRRVTANGTAVVGPVVTIDTGSANPQRLQIFSTVAGEWFVMYRASYNEGPLVTRIVDDEVVATEVEVPLSDATAHFATTDGILAGWYTNSGEWKHKWSAFGSGSTDAIAHDEFGVTGPSLWTFSEPAASLAFAFRNYAKGRVDFSSVNAQGWECPSVAAPDAADTVPIGIVKVPDGWVIVQAYNPSGLNDEGVYFSQVYEDCSTSSGFAQQSSGYQGRSVISRVAGNGHGFAMVWGEANDEGPGTVRLFGPNVCDDPDQ